MSRAVRDLMLSASPLVCAWVIRDMAERFEVVRRSRRWDALQGFADDLQALGILSAFTKGVPRGRNRRFGERFVRRLGRVG